VVRLNLHSPTLAKLTILENYMVLHEELPSTVSRGIPS